MMRSPNPHVTMEFQGGEALMAFDNIIHNKNRVRPGRNSYELTIENIKKCVEELGTENVSALLTTSTLSLDYPIEIVDEYYNQNLRNIFLRPISPYGFAVRNNIKNAYDVSRFLEFYKKAFERILEYNLNGNFYREDYATIILKKILTPFPVGYVDLQSPAGMVNNVIVFNYDGKVYATDESRMLAEMKDYKFYLGTLGDSTYKELFYGNKVKEFSEVWINESLAGCSECAFQAYCGADPVFNWRTQGDLYGYRPSSSFCKRNMEIIRYLFDLMDSSTDIEKVFRTWLN